MQDDKYLIPSAVIVAGFIIAAAVVYSSNSSIFTGGVAAVGSGDTVKEQNFGNANSPAAQNVASVNGNDHIRGNSKAPVKIIEFSDIECPFCKRFHPTVKQIVDEYKGQVAWVYRHFPLESIHSRARRAAEASECANRQGKFWEYHDKLFENQQSLDINSLKNYASQIGLDNSKFNTCLDRNEAASKVASDLQQATDAQGRGTPYFVLINKDGETIVVSGAQPWQSFTSAIQSLQ